MNIGILKTKGKDNRVPMLPETVKDLIKLKVNIQVEKDSGKNAYIKDSAFEEAGATISDRKTVLSNADLLISISPPDFKELSGLKDGKSIISVFNPLQQSESVKEMQQQSHTFFSLDIIPRTTRAQSMDILSSMATIAGYKAVLEAANHLPKFFPMFMSAAGTIKPAKVLILGAGVAGLQAIATSRKLGAVVEVFDVRSAVKEEVLSLGGKFIEIEGAKEDAEAGGYAVEQTEDYKEKQSQLIHDHAIKANAVICTAQIPGKKAPVLLKKETVEEMQAGAVIIDLAASTGGNCELTKNDETIVHNEVSIIGNSHYPSAMPTDASKMFGKNLFNFLKILIDEEGQLALNMEDEIIKGTCVVHEKEIMSDRVKQFMNQ